MYLTEKLKWEFGWHPYTVPQFVHIASTAALHTYWQEDT